MRFTDKVCVVTGGGSGIGRAACRQFAYEGGKPEDIAAAICFPAAPEARFINGTTLVADGGRLNIL